MFMYVYEVRACCSGFTWPEHVYFDEGSVKAEERGEQAQLLYYCVRYLWWSYFVHGQSE